MKFGRAHIPQEASFDLTPLVDVVLLLIIFFTMTTHFAKTQVAPLDLPGEPGDKAPIEQMALTIDLHADGTLEMLGSAVDMTEVVRMVQGELARVGPGLDLVIRAERTAPARHLNRLADSLALIGVRNWKLATAGDGGG
jgi:biopolymer transport protein ExbD